MEDEKSASTDVTEKTSSLDHVKINERVVVWRLVNGEKRRVLATLLKKRSSDSNAKPSNPDEEKISQESDCPPTGENSNGVDNQAEYFVHFDGQDRRLDQWITKEQFIELAPKHNNGEVGGSDLRLRRKRRREIDEDLSTLEEVGARADHHRKANDCKRRNPPGEAIYVEGDIKVYEVFGALEKVDSEGTHIAAMFSKEMYSANNLACIMTLPCYQRKGYGNLMIQLSYEMSKRAKYPGTPERPFSDLGEISYKKYWLWVLLEFFDSAAMRKVEDVTVDDLEALVGINKDDIKDVMEPIGLLSHLKGGTYIVHNPKLDQESGVERPNPPVRRLNPKCLPLFNTDGEAKTFLGTLDAVFMIAYASGLFFWGWLGDRLNPKHVIVTGMIGSAVMLTLFGAVPKWFGYYNAAYYVLTYILFGLMQACGWPSEIAIMANWFGKANRGFVMGAWASCQPLGNVFGSFFTSWVLPFGYESTFYMNGFLLMIGAFIVMISIDPKPKETQYTHLNDVEHAERSRAAEGEPISIINAILLPGVLANALAIACIMKRCVMDLKPWLSKSPEFTPLLSDSPHEE
ncbi:MOZ/SAS family protein [Teladorsagia circumcincta]|uniref:histone acetyltransferase n=1 Tax=Teladorsagia circumcincta TaxID=45464 RepID=A0A2G9UYR2_TELCI|nr:MOZ/SAS family protein [Teladorsagia circumcincta]